MNALKNSSSLAERERIYSAKRRSVWRTMPGISGGALGAFMGMLFPVFFLVKEWGAVPQNLNEHYNAIIGLFFMTSLTFFFLGWARGVTHGAPEIDDTSN